MTIRGIRTLTMIRKNLTYFRKRVMKKSLDEMSLDTSIARDTLHRLENNEDREKPLFPNLKTLLVMAEYFNVEIGDFISRDIEIDEVCRLEDNNNNRNNSNSELMMGV